MTVVDRTAAPPDPDARTVAAALAGAALAGAAAAGIDGAPATPAGLAWRWAVGTDALDLYAVDASAPEWRETCLGAGAALHRARRALVADGLGARVRLLPGTPSARRGQPDGDPAHLAHLVVAGTVDTAAEAAARTATRRALARALVVAARAEGVRLRVVTDAGTLAGVLHGPDTREAWLRAGAALSAVRLVAHRHGRVLELVQRRHIGEREGWLGVGIATPYARLRLRP